MNNRLKDALVTMSKVASIQLPAPNHVPMPRPGSPAQPQTQAPVESAEKAGLPGRKITISDERGDGNKMKVKLETAGADGGADDERVNFMIRALAESGAKKKAKPEGVPHV